ncbi:MAG TPA: PAS domain S-box protein [Gammaproteobacteria bacterium]|nr:PAS domain S-box protein [Gammaproteobacteria bacterium]
MPPSPSAWRYVVAAGLLGVAATDPLTLTGFAHGTLYLPFVLLAMLTRSPRFIVGACGFAAVMTGIGLWLSPPAPDGFPQYYAVVNRLASLAAIGVGGWLAIHMSRLVAWLETTIATLEGLQAELAEQHRLLHVAGAAGRLGGWSLCLATGEFRWSDEVADILGNPPGKPPSLGQVASLIVPGFRPELDRMMLAARMHGTPFSTEFQVTRMDGARVWLRVNCQPGRDAQGRVVVLEGAVQDVTRRKQAETQLALLAQALDSAADPVMITRLDTTIEWVNAAFTTVIGYAPGEVIGRKPRDLLKSGVHDEHFYREMWRTLGAGQVWSGEMVNRHRDGSLAPEHVTITPILDADRRPTHFIAIKRDLSRQKQIDRRLREIERIASLRGLSEGLEQQLGPALRAVREQALELAGEFGEDSPGARRAGSIVRAAERGLRVTEGLHAFAQRQSLAPQDTDVNLLLISRESMLRRTAGDDVRLELLHSGSLWPARVDPAALEKALISLVLNAGDAMPDGGRLVVETANVEVDREQSTRLVDIPPGHYVRVSVTDTGVGIAAEHLSRVFEPFFTVRGEARDHGGFGLPMVYGFARQSGGGVTIASEPGRGTTVGLYLPRSEPATA